MGGRELNAAELVQLLEDLKEAMEPYVDEENPDAVSSAARAAIQNLVETGAIELQ